MKNAMAACGIALAMGVPTDKDHCNCPRFQAVEHRIDVTEKHGVRFYNDSKGTNPDAAIKGISAMTCLTLLNRGGYDKDASYDAWIESFHGKVKKLVFDRADERKDCCVCKGARLYGYYSVRELRGSRGCLLSECERGGCGAVVSGLASWGMFSDYEERGRIFKECVYALP